MAKPAECLSDERLEALLEGRGGGAEAEMHIEICGRCRARLEAVAGLGAERISAAAAEGVVDASLQEAMIALRRKGLGAAAELSPHEQPLAAQILEATEQVGMLGRFAGYDIVAQVAAGGMGVVFQGFDPTLQRMVAIKVLAPALAASSTARIRFLREARAAAAINHEHVVAIHAVGEERGLPYLVMPFVKGQSLQMRLEAGGSLGFREVLRIGREAVAGLAAAHAQGLIHRDVKPGNILLEEGSERVKLTDFGLARAADAPEVTRPGFIAGTPEFMAPEQARGERLDARADLFGLGTVMYVMASGVSPFAAETSFATLKKVCELTPVPLHEINPDQPRVLSDLVARLMAKNREDRYPDAITALRAFDQALSPVPVQREPESGVGGSRAPDPVQAGIRRRRTMAWAGALLLTCAVLAVWLAMGHRAGTDLPFRHRNAAGVATLSTNLAELLERRGTGDVIELNWDGPRSVPPVRAEKTPVHFRAAKGRYPVILHGSKSAPWLLSDAPVRMEGIELRTEAVGATATQTQRAAASGSSMAESIRRPMARLMRTHEVDCQLLVLRGAELALVNCRLASASAAEEPQVPILLMDCPRAVLRNTEVYNPGGPAIAWKTVDGNRLSLSNCALVARSALLTTSSGVALADFDFERCTFAGSFLIAAVSGAERLRGRGIDNVFSIRRPILTGPGATLPGRHRWRGIGNVYERVGADFGFPMPATEEGSLSMDLGLDDRVRTKVGEATFSAATDLDLSVELRTRIGRPVGMDPAGLGPGNLGAESQALRSTVR